MNPMVDFTDQSSLNRVYLEPFASEETRKLWGLVDNIVTDSGVKFSNSWGQAVISWLNAHYILPEGYNNYYVDSPAEYPASHFNVSDFTFI